MDFVAKTPQYPLDNENEHCDCSQQIHYITFYLVIKEGKLGKFEEDFRVVSLNL